MVKRLERVWEGVRWIVLGTIVLLCSCSAEPTSTVEQSTGDTDPAERPNGSDLRDSLDDEADTAAGDPFDAAGDSGGSETTPDSQSDLGETDVGLCKIDDAPDLSEPADVACVRVVEPIELAPEVEWQWSSNPINSSYAQIMASPAIGQLNDDNEDGSIDQDDIPDIVFTTFAGAGYQSAGAVVAISGDGSQTHWSVRAPGGHPVGSASGVVIGDLEGDGSPEVCVSGISAAVVCLNGNGTFKWAAEGETSIHGNPAMADMDGDGSTEVIFGRQVFDALGDRIGLGGHGRGGRAFSSFAVNMDDDDELEVVAGNAVYDIDGSLVWYDGEVDGLPAVADLNGDLLPDVARSSFGSLLLTDNSGEVLRAISLPDGSRGGAPTIADFDGDGQVEIGVADMNRYSVLEVTGDVLWSNETVDQSSSATGSSVFDFEGDGRAEVIYADEHTLWIYDGLTGDVRLEETSHSSGTLWEYPLVADVDGDGAAEIVLAGNDYAWSGWRGITILGDPLDRWMGARPVWNQFAYHITNVNSDGSIPRHPLDNWETINNFRTAARDESPAHWLPDLSIGAVEPCLTECGQDAISILVPVLNSGRRAAESVIVTLEVDGAVVAEQTVDDVASGSVRWVGPFRLSLADFSGADLVIRVDSTNLVEECDEGNNALILTWPCERER